ncbi:MAG: dTDP-4-dehydrorhamnose reductase [Oscillospiraceae bacterium]
MNNTKVLITGSKGQLGSDILSKLISEGFCCIGVDISHFNLVDRESTINFILKEKPDVIIHCAAYVAVDKAEQEQELCYEVNVNGTKHICDAANKINAKLIYFSTDYVFNNDDNTPILVNSNKDPVNHYGKTKSLGEDYIIQNISNFFILRTSWIYGVRGNNFTKTMINLSKTKDKITVVSDQVGSPTFTEDVASVIGEFVKSDKYGVYNVTNEGFCSWYEFAKEIFRLSNIKIVVEPCLSKNYVTLAKRPKNSRLDKEKLSENGFTRLPSWENALKRYLKNL